MHQSTTARRRNTLASALYLVLIVCSSSGAAGAWASPAPAISSAESMQNGVGSTAAYELGAWAQNSSAVRGGYKSHYGHYFATHYSDTPAKTAMLCEQAGVSGVIWRQSWNQVERTPGAYNFASFDQVLRAIAASRKPSCQLWVFVEFKSFDGSPSKNPCPKYLQAAHSGPNVNGNGAATCFMWEPTVRDAYIALVRAAAHHFDSNPHVEGFVIQESSLGFSGKYSQDVGNGGTYTPLAWRNALITIVDQCAAAFAHSRCMAFVNFLHGQQSYIHDISAAIAAIPNHQVCLSGPDLLPNERSLYQGSDAPYQVMVRHPGCRADSAQNDSFQVPGCTLDCIFHFAVGGTLGAFPVSAPLSAGLCVNSYLFWNDRGTWGRSSQDWHTAQRVMNAHPYGPEWYGQCTGDPGPP